MLHQFLSPSVAYDTWQICCRFSRPKTTLFCLQNLLHPISKLDIENNSSTDIDTATILCNEVILKQHISVLSFLYLSTKDDVSDLQSMGWIPYLHNNQLKQRYISGSSKCTNKTFLKT